MASPRLHVPSFDETTFNATSLVSDGDLGFRKIAGWAASAGGGASGGADAPTVGGSAPAPTAPTTTGALILDPKAGGDQPQGFAGTGGPSVGFTPVVVAAGGEILVNTTTANDQSWPQLTALSNGGFVVTWTDESMSGGDTSGTAVRA